MSLNQEYPTQIHFFGHVTWLGGLLFGIGMTYASGCGNKVLIRLGEAISSLFVLITAGAMAYLMTRTDFYGIVFHSWMQQADLILWNK